MDMVHFDIYFLNNDTVTQSIESGAFSKFEVKFFDLFQQYCNI